MGLWELNDSILTGESELVKQTLMSPVTDASIKIVVVKRTN
jgi:hypothetical protein